MYHTVRRTLLLAAAALGIGVGKADATLTLDIRAMSGTGAATVLDGKHVSLYGPNAAGSTVTFGLYAVVIPTGGNDVVDEALLRVVTSVITYAAGPKNIHGDLGAVALSAPFQVGPSAYPGAVADLNADGDLDVGGPYDISAPINHNFIDAYAAFPNIGAVPGVSTDLPGSPAGREWLLGTTTLVINGIVDLYGDPIFANFVIPQLFGPPVRTQRARFSEDGVVRDGSTALVSTTMFTAQPVTIGTVPEPSAAALLLTGALGAFAFRRRRRAV